MPTKPTAVTEKSIKSQSDRRYLDTFYDQHKSARFPNGRPWTGYREFLSGSENPSSRDGFVSPELQRGDHQDPERSNWDAPWVPEVNGGKASFYDFDFERKRIRIRYDRVISHDQQAERDYFLAAAKLAVVKEWPAVEYGKTPSFQITAHLGVPPRSPRIAQAAQAGDPWLLGLSEEPNDVLAELLGFTSSGFKMPEPTFAPPLTPEKVLATSNEDLIKMIANVVTATLDAREAAKKGAARERMANARSHKKPKANPVAA